jgi:hypothetical protein
MPIRELSMQETVIPVEGLSIKLRHAHTKLYKERTISVLRGKCLSGASKTPPIAHLLEKKQTYGTCEHGLWELKVPAVNTDLCVHIQKHKPEFMMKSVTYYA